VAHLPRAAAGSPSHKGFAYIQNSFSCAVAHPVTHEKLALPSSAIIGVGVGLGFDSDCNPDSDSDPDGWWM